MNTRLTAALTLALCAFGSAHAADIKPGLWEFKSKLAMPGMPDMSAQMEMMQQQMKNLPPEARAELAEWSAREYSLRAIAQQVVEESLDLIGR